MASVLVTGTSRGIGLETALVLGRAGYTVYATMRNPDGAPSLSQAAGKTPTCRRLPNGGTLYCAEICAICPDRSRGCRTRGITPPRSPAGLIPITDRPREADAWRRR